MFWSNQGWLIIKPRASPQWIDACLRTRRSTLLPHERVWGINIEIYATDKMDTSLGSIGGANNVNVAVPSNNLSPSQAAASTNNLINGLNSSLGLQSLQNNHFNRNELQVRSSTRLFIVIATIKTFIQNLYTCHLLRISYQIPVWKH